MSIYFWIAGIFIALAGALTSFILTIIYVAGSKNRPALIWGVVFLMSLILGILSVVQAVQWGSGKIKDGFSWFGEKAKENASGWNHAEGEYYGFIPSWNKDTVSSLFYETKSGKECVPLVYPYRFVSNSDFDYSANLERYPLSSDSSLREWVYIDEFAFDSVMLLARRDNQSWAASQGKPNELPDHTWLLLNFRTGTSIPFQNDTRLLDSAVALGYSGKRFLNSFYSHMLAQEGE